MVALRPMALVDDPPVFPNVCMQCGLGRCPQRDYFIDIGIDVNSTFMAVREGVLYLCNECARNVALKLIELMAEADEIIRLDNGRTNDDLANEPSPDIDRDSSEPDLPPDTSQQSELLNQSDFGAIFSSTNG